MKKVLYFVALLVLSLNTSASESLFGNNTSQQSLFGSSESALSAEEAFKIDHKSTNDTLTLSIMIEPEHYLYEHKLKLSINGKEQIVNINNSVTKIDPHYGEIQAIYNNLNIKIKNLEKIETYRFEYQGCSEKFGICYPQQEVFVKKKSKNNTLKTTLSKKTPSIIEGSMQKTILVDDKKIIESLIKKENIEAPLDKITEPLIIEEFFVDSVVTPIKKENIEITLQKIIEPLIIEETFVDSVVTPIEKEEIKTISYKNEENLIKKEETFLSKYLDIENLKESLSSNSLMVTLGIFFLSGILISFTPCVLPMIPIISSIVVGNRKENSQMKAFTLSLSYVLGSSVTYAIIGAIAAVFSKNIQMYMQNSYIVGIFSFILVLFSLSLFGLFNITLPNKITEKTTNISNKLSGGTYIGVFFMGMISTLIVSPCVAAPLAAAITYITTDSGEILTGALSLFSFGLGIGIVLIIITSLLTKIKLSNPTLMNEAKYISGTLIMAVAIYMAERIIPANSAIYLYEILLLSYIANIFARNYEKMKKFFIILILLITSVIYINNQSNINKNILKIDPVVKEDVVKLKFENLETLEDLEIRNQFALIKVTADWCTYCQTMEKEIFEQEDIKVALSDFQLIKLDLTKSNKEKEKIMKAMSVVAPPALFFYKDGKMLHKKIGSLSKDRMLVILEALKNNEVNK